ncbi:outer membrane protein assembly factor [Acidobacteria bacterium AB60]|nr:outer membrane protein assembly factor [Acidobacteria bacterium AB60]
MAQWEGLQVNRIIFEGTVADRLTSAKDHLPQASGVPLSREDVAASLRQLYGTGLFDQIEALGQRDGNGVDLIFRGEARTFIGTVTVDGAKGANVNTQLERAARLNPGTRYTAAKMSRALESMREVVAENGFHEAKITFILTPHPAQLLTDVAFKVISGPQARVGSVAVAGDSGMTVEEFRRFARLRAGALTDRETVNRALAGVLKHYRSQERLEAEIKLEAQEYAAHKVNYRFTANRGPVVRVVVEGARLGSDRIKRLVPVYEEGTVDEDLLNEGNRRTRDYFQALGYFDVKVDHKESGTQTQQVTIVYSVQLGERRHVERVSVDGNRYFNSGTLEQLLSVHAANAFDRHGAYNQALVSADVAALQSVYQNNGFSRVKVTPETGQPIAGPSSGNIPGPRSPAASDSTAPLTLVYHIEEGPQQRVGAVQIIGNSSVQTPLLAGLLNTEAGQLFSPRNLAGDRDALMTDYLSRGFDRARVDIDETNDPTDPSKVNVIFRVSEGQQTFVRDVLLTGLHYTRRATVDRAITLRPGDPLSASALDETQSNLYEFALFNEVNTAVENPNGGESSKTVLLQAVEARRWTLTYGAGFEVQTGTPVNGCQGLLATGVKCTPNGRTGVSPRGLLAITRNNLFGREQSASVQGNYGSLEQRVDLVYQNPHLAGRRNFGMTFTGGYANSQSVTTYVASRLEAGFRFSQTFNRPGSGLSRANTFIYAYDFRRVKVAENTLQVFPAEVPVLAAAVTVGGPGFTWIRDSRDSAVDAHRGTYTSFQEFLSIAPFGAQAQFNRIDASNSSYFGFGKGKYVLARNTRYGQERAFGGGDSQLIPIPERLYAGGATSLRGFSINSAGPRDPETGFPIGGAGALVNSTELRLPPAILPYFGNSLSMVLFHDMGNVFTNAGDAWASILRVSQPNRDSCKVLTPLDTTTSPPTEPYPHGSTNGPETSTGHQGICSFNYFSHAPGLGLRYHTPVGPIRLDFSYNLNPPIFPVNVNYSQQVPTDNQHVGAASHFNFFFSLGQTF